MNEMEHGVEIFINFFFFILIFTLSFQVVG